MSKVKAPRGLRRGLSRSLDSRDQGTSTKVDFTVFRTKVAPLIATADEGLHLILLLTVHLLLNVPNVQLTPESVYLYVKLILAMHSGLIEAKGGDQVKLSEGEITH